MVQAETTSRASWCRTEGIRRRNEERAARVAVLGRADEFDDDYASEEMLPQLRPAEQMLTATGSTTPDQAESSTTTHGSRLNFSNKTPAEQAQYDLSTCRSFSRARTEREPQDAGGRTRTAVVQHGAARPKEPRRAAKREATNLKQGGLVARTSANRKPIPPACREPDTRQQTAHPRQEGRRTHRPPPLPNGSPRACERGRKCTTNGPKWRSADCRTPTRTASAPPSTTRQRSDSASQQRRSRNRASGAVKSRSRQWTGQNRRFVGASKPAISGGPRLELR